VQFRAKNSPARDMAEMGRRLLRRARARRVPLVINDRVDVALTIGADGVHLPESGLSIGQTRRLAPGNILVGTSRHSETGAGAAARDGADYVVFSPAWPTESKPGVEPLGPERIEAAAHAVAAAGAAGFALGGVDAERAAAARRLGCHGVAAIRAWLCAADPAAAVANLLAVLAT
jgi:thiamine-phosphate pyrophosphorylase